MTMSSSDESLMAAVREGAVAELEILFDRHHLTLYEFFFRMTGDRAASENLVQDCFYRILKYRDTFRDEGRFRSWLFRIARNAHHDMFKKRSVASVCEDDPELMRKDKPATLRCALLKLPEDRRELVILSQYHQLTTDEVAELLDIDVPAANVRLHRAMMELRDLYRSLTG